jgi:ABC-type branched-subunit amino acid transport system ATPase component
METAASEQEKLRQAKARLRRIRHYMRLAQFVYVMEEGRVALEGPSAEVAASEHVQRAYLGVA